MPFAAVFGCEALAADEGALFADEGLEFALVAGVEAVFAALVAAFELALAFAVLGEQAGGGGGELGLGDAGGGFDEG